MRNTLLLFILPLLLIFGCQSTDPTPASAQSQTLEIPLLPDMEASIADYVVEAFEDSKGTLWFGTMGKGVAKYDGKELSYLTAEQGLGNNTVAAIAEGPDGSLWFGTHEGLVRYDGQAFERYTAKDGLCHFRVSQLLFDRKGLLWIGTWGGVCTFDGEKFDIFELPIPEVELKDYQTTFNWITEIIEDRAGNIWVARDGYGACKYDGKELTHFTSTDGLLSNNVQALVEDQQGNIWIGSRIAERDHPDPEKRTGPGGLCRYDGREIIQFPEVKGLTETDLYSLYSTPSGKVWIGASGLGLYIYDGEHFSLYDHTDRMDRTKVMGIQALLEDRKGRKWVGMSGGLFRLTQGKLRHIGTYGPWE